MFGIDPEMLEEAGKAVMNTLARMVAAQERTATALERIAAQGEIVDLSPQAGDTRISE